MIVRLSATTKTRSASAANCFSQNVCSWPWRRQRRTGRPLASTSRKGVSFTTVSKDGARR